MRESTFEDQLANMNLSITPDHFVSVVEAWKAGEKECGAYVDHGAYTIEATADELHVTTEAKFQNRDAELEFVFDKNLYLESLTVGAHYSMGEILKKAGMNPLIGSAGVSAVPMAARVSQKVGAEADPTNFLLMHAMGPNVAGVIGTAVAAGTFMAIFGVF